MFLHFFALEHVDETTNQQISPHVDDVEAVLFWFSHPPKEMRLEDSKEKATLATNL